MGAAPQQHCNPLAPAKFVMCYCLHIPPSIACLSHSNQPVTQPHGGRQQWRGIPNPAATYGRTRWRRREQRGMRWCDEPSGCKYRALHRRQLRRQASGLGRRCAAEGWRPAHDSQSFAVSLLTTRPCARSSCTCFTLFSAARPAAVPAHACCRASACTGEGVNAGIGEAMLRACCNSLARASTRTAAAACARAARSASVSGSLLRWAWEYICASGPVLCLPQQAPMSRFSSVGRSVEERVLPGD